MKPEPPIYSDPEIIEGIRQRDNAVLASVYQLFRPRIIAHVSNQGGSEQEAKDVFQDSVIIVFINIQKPEFQLTSSFYTYLHAICHNQWLKRFRQKNKHQGVRLDSNEVLMVSSGTSDDLEYAERQQFLIEKFNALGEGCRELLRLSIIEEKHHRKSQRIWASEVWITTTNGSQIVKINFQNSRKETPDLMNFEHCL